MSLLKRILKIAVAVVALTVGYQAFDHYRPQPIEPMTPQRRASHRIEYEVKEHPAGYCTGTAIGPHAILTASHCLKHSNADLIELDNAVRDYHIEKVLTDGRDHDVYLVDGPEFTNFVKYKVRQSEIGEHVFMYGSGHAVYPPRRLDGVRVDYDDPSDVDADAGEQAFSTPAVPGDSGSAVFNDDGTITAVTTYRLTNEWMFGWLTTEQALDFTPGFTPAQVDEALNFKPTEYVPPAKDKEVLENPFKFNPFFFLH